MTKGEIEAEILKNLIMSDEFVSQEDLKRVVKAMNQVDVKEAVSTISKLPEEELKKLIEKRPKVNSEGVEIR